MWEVLGIGMLAIVFIVIFRMNRSPVYQTTTNDALVTFKTEADSLAFLANQKVQSLTEWTPYDQSTYQGTVALSTSQLQELICKECHLEKDHINVTRPYDANMSTRWIRF
ncbi:hypothetical protein [uncultured Enterococcus sp.]|uniref:hypothetical protein n=1 Tax=uncultured Enterococcus sp. TaxID=167972 RepID=UPI0025E95FE1|nr:hypothetical protein [uncultured Enterococcus sp.]